jgi:phosphopantothenoylcysteine synthetase/decarboxylase
LKAQTQKEVRKVTRTRAWTVSIIATVSLLALVVGIGASTGQFGFPQGGTTVDAQAVTTGDGILNEQPSDAGFDEDDDDLEAFEEHEDADDEHEGDEEHENDD